MSYTSHGHHIPGSTELDPEDAPSERARCGGPGTCTTCTSEVRAWISSDAILNSVQAVQNSSDNFQIRAMEIVRQYVNANYIKGLKLEFDLYVVWFAKTLQNWKAIVCTTMVDGRMYEVTYNGDKRETYVDAYAKVGNVRIPD